MEDKILPCVKEYRKDDNRAGDLGMIEVLD